jgi:pimeloyl-ACP methyl ester carboxylesterase
VQHSIRLTFAALAVAVVLLAFMLGRLVDRMIFHPEPGIELRPEDVGVHGEEIYLTTEDGVRIHAFFLPSPGASRAILFLHGNAGNASHRLPNAAELMRSNSHVLLLDYRGYGLSEGRPDEAGVYADARAGLTYLQDEIGVPQERTVVFGRSLGGAVAVDLVQDRAIAGLILESTFPSLAAMAVKLVGASLAALAPSRFDSGRKIAKLRAPLLFFHGDRDEIVPYDLGLQLFAAAPEPKTFETIRGAGHNDTVQVGGRQYFDRIQRFLDEVAPQ